MDEQKRKEMQEAARKIITANIENLQQIFPEMELKELRQKMVNACKMAPALLNQPAEITTGKQGYFSKNIANLKILALDIGEDEIKEKWLNACFVEPKLFLENPEKLTGRESMICISRQQIRAYLDEPALFLKTE